jgi:hypothetical protein
MFKGLKATGSNIILRSSLFWMDGAKIGSTWGYLSRQYTSSYNAKMMQKMQKYGCNTMTFIVFHAGDPECVCNPFVGFPNTKQIMAGKNAVDMQELERWRGLLEPGKDPNVFFVPTIYCGDDSATTQNEEFHKWFLPPVIEFFRPYVKAFLIATEASKSMDVRRQERMIAIMKQAMGLRQIPVGVHNQGSKIAGNADFLAYEFSWHPSRGNDFTPEQVVAEARHVVRSYPNYIWFQEMNMHPESDRARAQVRALRELAKSEPRLIGIPGPM